jgi:hypothetical protein
MRELNVQEVEEVSGGGAGHNLGEALGITVGLVIGFQAFIDSLHDPMLGAMMCGA